MWGEPRTSAAAAYRARLASGQRSRMYDDEYWQPSVPLSTLAWLTLGAAGALGVGTLWNRLTGGDAPAAASQPQPPPQASQAVLPASAAVAPATQAAALPSQTYTTPVRYLPSPGGFPGAGSPAGGGVMMPTAAAQPMFVSPQGAQLPPMPPHRRASVYQDQGAAASPSSSSRYRGGAGNSSGPSGPGTPRSHARARRMHRRQSTFTAAGGADVDADDDVVDEEDDDYHDQADGRRFPAAGSDAGDIKRLVAAMEALRASFEAHVSISRSDIESLRAEVAALRQTGVSNAGAAAGTTSAPSSSSRMGALFGTGAGTDAEGDMPAYGRAATSSTPDDPLASLPPHVLEQIPEEWRNLPNTSVSFGPGEATPDPVPSSSQEHQPPRQQPSSSSLDGAPATKQFVGTGRLSTRAVSARRSAASSPTAAATTPSAADSEATTPTSTAIAGTSRRRIINARPSRLRTAASRRRSTVADAAAAEGATEDMSVAAPAGATPTASAQETAIETAAPVAAAATPASSNDAAGEEKAGSRDALSAEQKEQEKKEQQSKEQQSTEQQEQKEQEQKEQEQPQPQQRRQVLGMDEDEFDGFHQDFWESVAGLPDDEDDDTARIALETANDEQPATGVKSAGAPNGLTDATDAAASPATSNKHIVTSPTRPAPLAIAGDDMDVALFRQFEQFNFEQEPAWQRAVSELDVRFASMSDEADVVEQKASAMQRLKLKFFGKQVAPIDPDQYLAWRASQQQQQPSSSSAVAKDANSTDLASPGSATPRYPAKYQALLQYASSNELPPGVRKIDDSVKRPGAALSRSRMQPKPKPWEKKAASSATADAT